MAIISIGLIALFINPISNFLHLFDWNLLLGIVEIILAIISIFALFIIGLEIQDYKQNSKKFFAEGIISIRNILQSPEYSNKLNAIEIGNRQLRNSLFTPSEMKNRSAPGITVDITSSAKRNLPKMEIDLALVKEFKDNYEIEDDIFFPTFNSLILPVSDANNLVFQYCNERIVSNKKALSLFKECEEYIQKHSFDDDYEEPNNDIPI